MTTTGYFIWALWIIAIWVIISLISFLCLRKCKRAWLPICFIVIDIAGTAGMAYMANVSNSVLTWHYCMLLVAVYIVTFANFFSNFIYLVSSLIKRKSDRKKLLGLRMILSLILTILLAVYGTVNMQIVTASEHTYTSDKLTQDHTFIVIADLHVGTSQSMDTTRSTLAKVAAENPEFLILDGDITDEYTTKEEMEEVYRIIGEMDFPVYFVYGNHDRQDNADLADGRTYTEEELVEAITSNGITILQDEVVLIDDDISLLGREDQSNDGRKSADELPGRDESRYQITADHQPYGTDEMVQIGADLQVSGHTHAGQYAQLGLLSAIADLDCYGEYTHGNTKLYITSGASGWAAPYRTAQHCYYEVFHLVRQ